MNMYINRLLQTSLISIVVIMSSLGYAGQGAPELTLREGDFTYDNYKSSMRLVTSILEDYEKSVKYDPNSVRNYIGIPNSMLRLEGYGLYAQRDMIRLQLENEKLKNNDRKAISDLGQKLQKIEEQINAFISTNEWVD